MRWIAFVLLFIISCESSASKFVIGDAVATTRRCMGTSDEFAYADMQKASDERDEEALTDMMNKGELLVLNAGQPGTIYWTEKEKSQITILGGSKWWIANKFLKKR